MDEESHRKDVSDLLTLVTRFIQKWQPRLYLQDWRIEGRVVDKKGEVDDDSGAEFHGNWRHRTAVVLIPVDCVKRYRDGDASLPSDTDDMVLEGAVIHELLHVLENPFSSHLSTNIEWLVGTKGVISDDVRGSLKNYQEAWINRMVRVLMDADRLAGTW